MSQLVVKSVFVNIRYFFFIYDKRNFGICFFVIVVLFEEYFDLQKVIFEFLKVSDFFFVIF